MVRFLKRYQTPIAVLLSILVPLIVYRANSVSPGETNLVDRVVLFATSPLKQLLSWSTSLVSDSWYQYVDLTEARKENGELRRRLMLAERDLDILRTLEIENRHLTALLEMEEKNPEARLLAARIIAAGGSPGSRTLEIDRGSLAGVRRGMPVIAGQGLVGVIQQVGWSTAEILTIADEKVGVRAVVVRTRARGRIEGRGLWPAFSLKLSEVLRGEDVAVGDRVITSGLDGVFPAGVPIGEVTKVFVEAGVQHRVAEVEPYVDFARLELVSVLLQEDEDRTLVTPEPLRPPALRDLPDAGVPEGGTPEETTDASVAPEDAGS